jgi:transglutaminase-like putative cysteine protease
MSRSSCSTFCRCLNIPARYVNGHLGDIGVPVVDPMDFSAWIVPWGPAPRSLHGQRR